MERGGWVRLRAYGGEVITRRVVEIDDEMIAVCRDDEYQAAEREGREPITVAFWKEDIIDDAEMAVRPGSSG